MYPSRRQLLATLSAAAGVLVAGSMLPSLLGKSQAPQPRPSPNAPKNENVPMGLDGRPNANAPRQSEINRQNQAEIKLEVEKLCQMANELKEETLRVNPSDTLSLSFVKKAQAIEKLAKQIKDKAKG